MQLQEEQRTPTFAFSPLEVHASFPRPFCSPHETSHQLLSTSLRRTHPSVFFISWLDESEESITRMLDAFSTTTTRCPGLVRPGYHSPDNAFVFYQQNDSSWQRDLVFFDELMRRHPRVAFFTSTGKSSTLLVRQFNVYKSRTEVTRVWKGEEAGASIFVEFPMEVYCKGHIEVGVVPLDTTIP